MINVANWFEIPAKDFARAKQFYSDIFAKQLEDHPMPDPAIEYALLPFDMEKGVGGAIIKTEGCEPGADGPTVYLNGGEDLASMLARVEPSGGKIIMPKTSIGENGFMAQFIDTEGNRLALHSMN